MKQVKEYIIVLTEEKRTELAKIISEKTGKKISSPAELFDYLNTECTGGLYNVTFGNYVRIHLPSLSIWIYMGHKKALPAEGAYRGTALSIDTKVKETKQLKGITLKFEPESQKIQTIVPAAEKNAVRTVILTKENLDNLKEEAQALQNKRPEEIIDYLNKICGKVSYRKAFGVKLVFIENINVVLKTRGGKVEEIKRELGARGNEWAEVRYELEKK